MNCSAWCESHPVDYVIGLAKNSRLKQEIAEEMVQAEAEFNATGKPARVFKDFQYRTLNSWTRARRVVGKAEFLDKGANPRFIVTSLPPERFQARALYEDFYCARGDMENRIKEQQLDLFADRTSAATMRANQLRLYLSSAAYMLMHALRRLGLKDTAMAHAQCGTIRLKLLKIGARIRLTVRNVWISMSEASIPIPKPSPLSCGTCSRFRFVADDTIHPQPKNSLLHLHRAEVCLHTPNHAPVVPNESTSRPQQRLIPPIHRLQDSELAAIRFSYPKNQPIPGLVTIRASGLYHPNRDQRSGQTALDSRRQQRDDTTSRRRGNAPPFRGADDNEDNADSLEPSGPLGVAGDIFVTSRRRCEDIDFRLAPRPPRQDPSALVPIWVVQVNRLRFGEIQFSIEPLSGVESRLNKRRFKVFFESSFARSRTASLCSPRQDNVKHSTRQP